MLGLLLLAAISYALLQTLVVPALPTLPRELDTTTTGIAWVYVAFMLAACVATPIAGRLGDLFGPSNSGEAIPTLTSGSVIALPSGSLADSWVPTGANIPADGGQVSTIALPGTISGFQPRESYVYLPPAYFADNAEPLPVLILMHGVPGGPGDWTLGDRVQGVLNAYAAEHNGIAPVVVMPDASGGQVSNPLCTDSNLGKVGTYLSQDVPNAIAPVHSPPARSGVLSVLAKLEGRCAARSPSDAKLNEPSLFAASD